MDDSENNAKISDSAYSNSCSNSQSRRSSKSTHSGSNSSGSSGYGGKPGYSNNLSQPPEKRLKENDAKKKKQVQSENLTIEAKTEEEGRLPEPVQILESLKEDTSDVVPSQSPALASPEKGPESMDIATPENGSTKDEVILFRPDPSPVNTFLNYVTSRPTTVCADGFSCVISIHDGVVMYTTSSLTATLGFPKDMWVGRSFIDFVHPKDRNALASQITNCLALPKNLNVTQAKVNPGESSVSSMVCRIRRYRDLAAGFGVKNSVVTFTPFMLKMSFKNLNNDEGEVTYLVIQATPYFSAFSTPNETIVKPVPFVIRHAANGNLEFLDPDSVPYLGYLPQDVTDKDTLRLYHPNDLVYLRQVYETIVKEGGSPRSKPYRMLAQNGDYVQLETEWSSFINPWSKKLEFVIAKHHIVEGPTNPDVFQSPDPNKELKLSEDEMLKAQSLRDSIIKILNEVLTKPAEAAKQQMNKRCQDLATFMESLLEDQPKTDDDIRLEMQDPDHSYYERDSVMLGGISPHHDYNDSKSSTETRVSYNQLNYNETLQRYFESHPPYTLLVDINNATAENTLGSKGPNNVTGEHTPPQAQTDNSGNCDCNETKPGGTNQLGSNDYYQPIRLTEFLLSKHNAEMEKELVKMHRETRSSSKGERVKTSNEKKQKKKEHLARCNASFQPTSVGINLNQADINKTKPHGVKRGSKQLDADPGNHKHHCTSPRQSRRKQTTNTTTTHASPTLTTTAASSPWSHANPMNSMNTFILGVGIPPQMSIVSPVTAMPGMFPMHYVPATGQSMSSSQAANNSMPANSSAQFPAPTMQCMMYGQAVYGAPFMYSPMNPQVSYPVQENYMNQGMQYMNNLNPLGLASSNYAEACKPSLPTKTGKPHSANAWKDKKRAESQVVASKADQETPMTNTSANTSNRVAEAVRDLTKNKDKPMKLGNSEDTVDKTDGEASYSSFYSSFFKTESGSAEDSSDPKKKSSKEGQKSSFDGGSGYSPAFGTQKTKKVPRRKMEPPWMEHPSLVNEQLGQLYLDLQLEGVAARLTLEEGITSSSSSGEETTAKVLKSRRKKREYSKLVMIYEENSPLPPPDSPRPSSS